MIKSIKIKAIALYMLFLGLTALTYLSLPFFAIIFSVYKAYNGDWMIAIYASILAVFAHLTSEWYYNFFMDQHYYSKEIIQKIRE